MNNYLTNFELDQLAEVANIGAHRAATVLSQMLKRKLEINAPEVLAERIEKIVSYLGGQEELRTAVLLKILGDAPGIMLLIFTPESALNLANLLTKKRKDNPNILDELDRSALREVGNILSGASLTALSQFLNINLLQSVPDIATDMLGALIDEILLQIGKEGNVALVFNIKFSIEKEAVGGQLFFLFDPKSTARILELTKKKLSGDKLWPK